MAVSCKKGKDLWSKVVVACKEKGKEQDKMVVARIALNKLVTESCEDRYKKKPKSSIKCGVWHFYLLTFIWVDLPFSN